MIDLQSALRQYQLFPLVKSVNANPNASSEELVASNGSNPMNLLVSTFNPSAISASTAGSSNYTTMERARSGSFAQAQGAQHCTALLCSTYGALLSTPQSTLNTLFCLLLVTCTSNELTRDGPLTDALCCARVAQQSTLPDMNSFSRGSSKQASVANTFEFDAATAAAAAAAGAGTANLAFYSSPLYYQAPQQLQQFVQPYAQGYPTMFITPPDPRCVCVSNAHTHTHTHTTQHTHTHTHTR